jgi:hypothetical protein
MRSYVLVQYAHPVAIMMVSVTTADVSWEP